MAKISQYPDGGAIQDTDKLVIARAGQNFSILGSELGGGGGSTLIIKNTSGAIAAANDVGYIIYTASSGMEYKTTTTSADNKNACVVIEGGANNASIEVQINGRFTIPYAGTAPSQGDFLVFSTTATKVARQTTMSPEIIGIAMAAGSGGTVDALMLPGTVFIPYLSTENIWRNSAHSSGIFTATINGAPGATSFVYTPVSGNEDILNVAGTGELAKLMVYNSTRQTYRLVTACNTGTNTVTNVSITDTWANGDSITVANAAINDGLSPPFIGFDLSQQSEIPVLARAIEINGVISDSGAIGQAAQAHPYVAYASSKIINFCITQSVQQLPFSFACPLRDRKFGIRNIASGTGTKLTILKVIGYWLAVP